MRYGRTRLVVLACALLASACAPRETATAAGPGLPGTTWRLLELRSPDDATGVVRPPAGREYTMTLRSDGRVAMRLDCNSAGGTWTHTPSGDEGGTLAFGPLVMTRVFCGEGALDARIARDAELVRTYLLRDGRLYLDLMADGGTYVWERAAAAP